MPTRREQYRKEDDYWSHQAADNIDAIESLMDRVGLHDMLALMAEICREKATHVESNWQDTRLAKQWDRAADVIDTAAYSKAVKVLP